MRASLVTFPVWEWRICIRRNGLAFESKREPYALVTHIWIRAGGQASGSHPASRRFSTTWSNTEMISMSTPYKSPESNVEVKQELELTFSTLNFWRKFYIVLIWLSSAFIALILLLVSLNSDDFTIIAALIMGLLMLGLTYWHHRAIVKRDLTQITILAI